MSLRDVLVFFGVEVDQSQLTQTQQKTDFLLDTFRRGMGVVKGFGAAFAVRSLMRTADTFTTMNNRIRNVTDGAEDAAAAQRELIDVARETFSPVESVAQAFQRYSIATSELGISQSEVIDFTKRLTQATILSGASAAESNGALIQLAQGLSTNFQAAGQEIRSLQENAPMLAKIIAEAAGGSAGDLMQLAKAGKISAELVINAVREMGPELDAMFAKRVPTYEEAMTRLRIEWMLFVGELNEGSGVNRLIADLFVQMANALKQLTPRVREFARSGKLLQAALALLGATFIRYALLKNLGSLVGWLFRAQGAARLLWRVLMRFALPVLVLDELITLFRGGDTLIGRFIDKLFGLGSARAMVETVKGAFQSLLDTLALIFNPGGIEDWEMAFLKASEGIGKAFDAMFAGLWQVAKDFGEFFSLVIGKAVDWVVEKIKSIPGVEWVLDRARERGAQVASNDAGVSRDARTTIWAPPTLPPAATARVAGAPPPAPQVTNNIVVEGAATPAVAREIGQRAGSATSAALGRDRAAIGASVGVSP